MSEIKKLLIKNLGKTNNFAIKGLATKLLSNHFFNIFYSNARKDSKYSGKATISFDIDYEKDIQMLPKLLEHLERNKIKASFACIGMLVEKYPEDHKQIVDHGHDIINHTYSHPYHDVLDIPERFHLLSLDRQREEIVKCHEVCINKLGYTPSGMRIPHFAIQHTNTIYNILKEINYTYSSSILATQSDTFGIPYANNNITEFPITTCPKHPFQAFDTYHSFKSKWTSHDGHNFIQTFEYLVNYGLANNMYINLYLDPRDIVNIPNFDQFLSILKKMKVSTYTDLAKNFET